ncbi:MAG TPA: precorrin-6A synthase (deacetylating) [Pseudonocardiaceae bacterium]
MRRILVIGIGAGDPEQLTVRAVRLLREADVFFFLDKGDAKQDLLDARQAILDRYREPGGYRVVTAPDVDRDRAPTDYPATVAAWRTRRADLYADLIAGLGEDEIGAILAWGDPTLYDNTVPVLAEVADRGDVPFDFVVEPGISSISALVARHRVALNRIGRPVQITTGRRLAEDGFPAGVDDVVVMLDSRGAFTRFAGEPVDVYWGAYLGTPDEIVVAGPVGEVAEHIQRVRAEARERKGWIMDTYLLRRVGPDEHS